MASTDVRAWLREEGFTPPSRGPIPAELQAAYDDAHGTGSATEADFPSTAPAAPASMVEGEQAPRSIRGRGKPAERLRERLWAAGRGAKSGRPKKPGRHARVSLTGFVEDLWGDLAWMAAPLPPVQRVLYMQAPYAGIILEDSLKGTIIDPLLQPVTRNVEAVKAVNGLLGPPVCVAGILLTGERAEVPVLDDEGRQVVNQDGNPVFRLDYTPRTKVMFMGLKYSLLQMTKITPGQLAAVKERAEDRITRGKEIDRMIAWIFGMEEPPDLSAEEDAIRRGQAMMGKTGSAPAASDPVTGATGWPQTADSHPYPYPAAPPMDMTGADPGRA